jgi:SAM-dependent methyltransferase
MVATSRNVLPERLDHLDSQDPLARRSRRDLRKVHIAMGSVSILRRILPALGLPAQPRRIIDLGAGDGTLMLRLARALRPRWIGVELTLLDRQDLVAAETREAYRELGWTVTVLRADALSWARASPTERYDLCVAVLFLHHFDSSDLNTLLAGAGARTKAFVGCEPRRNALSRLGSACVGLIGANEVTREDAVKSVAAGFLGLELSAAWTHVAGEWVINEHRSLPFSHCFTAVRAGTRFASDDHARAV